MPETGPAWAERVKQTCGSTLRSIVYLSPETREVVFVRDDIDTVPAAQLDRALQTLMFDVVGADHDEQTYDHGGLLCVTRRFEDAVELHFPVSQTEGVAVALESTVFDQMDDPVSQLHAIIPASE